MGFVNIPPPYSLPIGEWSPGEYYGSATASGTFALPGGLFAYALPLYVPARGSAIDRLGAGNVSIVSGAGGLGRGLVYTDNDGYPGNLLFDPGADIVFDVGTGPKEHTVVTSLPGVPLWHVVIVNAANTATVTGCNAASNPVGWVGANTFTAAITGYRVAIPSFVPPAVFPAGPPTFAGAVNVFNKVRAA